MAKHTVKHTCGHTSNLNLVGPMRERERKLAWLRTIPCQSCEREAESTKAAANAKTSGLVTLSGSGKQIAWAESLRAKAISEITGYETKVIAVRKNDPTKANAILKAIDNVRTQATARWWIDHRDATIRDMLREAIA